MVIRELYRGGGGGGYYVGDGWRVTHLKVKQEMIPIHLFPANTENFMASDVTIFGDGTSEYLFQNRMFSRLIIGYVNFSAF